MIFVQIHSLQHAGSRQRDQRAPGPRHRRIRRVSQPSLTHPAPFHSPSLSLTLSLPPNSIGGACAKDLFASGANLALTYSSNKAAIDTLIAELQKQPQWAGAKVTSHQADMASADDIQRLFSEISAQHGQDGPDILVSNAGYGKRIPDILDIPIDEFDHTLAVNLRASFILTKLAVPHMKAKRWGRIVFIGSLAAFGGGINGCHYAASKAGLQSTLR